jgi:AhpD family alkylhydroperoxidase
MTSVYSVDTNVFIDWWERRYPPDVFPSVQKAMERLSQGGLLFAPERVHEEIDASGSKGLKAWAKQNKSIFLPHDQQLQAEAQSIQFAYPDLIDNNSPHDEADRWVIAVAKIKGCPVVTHETAARAKKKPERSLFIPDVCKAMNIQCIELLELMRQQKWTF